MFYDRQPESLADFKADVYIVDDEVASTNWMFDRHGRFSSIFMSPG